VSLDPGRGLSPEESSAQSDPVVLLEAATVGVLTDDPTEMM
jgi:hypothetical protein